jgi:uncharacterized protein involved in exopolysaccharide biosynthesis
MADDIVALVKARSMLIILLATCRETLTALDAAGNVLNAEMTEDLRRMIARTEAELEVLTTKVEASRGAPAG